eukprot:TRINITY_DN2370_c0_g2_i1.p1 TRINITY_DN2370_c0_g2~~TRINITY_DN2370_c0_g2_i1.p1  ORF type:complete len:377 (+),score=100.73 TRINITY_DN2370_c0_g2_i1:163-1131(+)
MAMPAFGLGTWRAAKGAAGASVKHALAVGYRSIDLAPRYQNEAEIGAVAFAPAFTDPAPVPRAGVFIASKLWNTDHDNVHNALTKTLADLQLDYLDLWYMHWPVALAPGHDTVGNVRFNAAADLGRTWAAMEAEVQAGRVRALGVSNFNVEQLQALLQTATIKPVANQVELHPYLPQGRLVQFCRAHGIRVVAYCPIGSPGNAAQNVKAATPLIAHETVTSVADATGLTPAQVLLKWGLQHGITVIPKSVTPARIEENIAAWRNPQPLSDEHMAAIDGIAAADGPVRYLRAEHYYRPGQSYLEFWGDDGGSPILPSTSAAGA